MRLAIALLLASSVALANTAVDEGKRLYDDLEYKRAERQLTAALQQKLTRDERVTALRYLGLTQATLNELGAAAATFKQLLELDPTATLDRSSTSPRILDLFERVRSTMPQTKQEQKPIIKETDLALTHVAPSEARPNRPLDLAIDLDDPDQRAARLVVRFRHPGDRDYSELQVPGGGRQRIVQLPGIVIQKPEIDYYIEALDAQGKVLTSAGNPEQPLVVPVRDEPRATTPVYKRWWFWTIAGAVLVGAGVGIALAATMAGGGPSGSSTVTVSFVP